MRFELFKIGVNGKETVSLVKGFLVCQGARWLKLHSRCSVDDTDKKLVSDWPCFPCFFYLYTLQGVQYGHWGFKINNL